MVLSDLGGHFLRFFSEGQVEKILEGSLGPRIESLRYNPARISLDSFLLEINNLGVTLQECPFLAGSFWLPCPTDSKKIKESLFYQSGNAYFQGISGLWAADILKNCLTFNKNKEDENKEKNLWDMCAAPGSKTSWLAPYFSVVATEKSSIRLKRLKYNLELLGVREKVKIFKCEAARLFSYYQGGAFSKILADVPCSGEGTLNLSDSSHYSSEAVMALKKRVAYWPQRQKELLRLAFESLCVGGVLLYSTCTLNFLENEEVILSLLSLYPEQVECELPENIPNFAEFQIVLLDQYPKFKAIRIFPSPYFEGFFICLIRKKISKK